jgi:hypothetical protein
LPLLVLQPHLHQTGTDDHCNNSQGGLKQVAPSGVQVVVTLREPGKQRIHPLNASSRNLCC